MLRFFTAAIQTHVGPRFDAVVDTIGLSDYVGKVVQQAVSYDPLPYLTETQYKFPLVAAYRVSEDTSKWQSIAHYKIIGQFKFLYILPPLSAPDQLVSLSPLLTHVSRTILDRSVHGSDEAIESQRQWWIESGIQSINVKATSYGSIPKLDSNIFFPAIEISIEMVERHMETSEPGTNFEELTGLDGYIEISQDDEIDLEFIHVSEDLTD